MVENYDAISYLGEIAGELAQIHRGKHYAQWRGDAVRRVDRVLSSSDPFRDYATTRVFSGVDASALIDGQFGEWAIDRLVENMKPKEIIEAFHAEVARNSCRYEEVSPIIGVKIEAEIEIAQGIHIVPPSNSMLDPDSYSWRYQWPMIPEGTGFLVQMYDVTPAFVQVGEGDAEAINTSETLPNAETREAAKQRVRRACLLSSDGGVEIPVSVALSDRKSLFQVDGNSSSRPFATKPNFAFTVNSCLIKAVFDALAAMSEREVLERAIDRLGRSRLAIDPIDRAIDLGIAAEIVLMHDVGSSNAEITYKISSRAAWLIGENIDARTEIFELMRDLYGARSKAVHSGKFPTKKPVDLDAADRMVSYVIRLVLERGQFPDWKRLALGSASGK
tara:strand:- start:71745 stop:72914 length:1170 start_codon:yes stop_codon:yes gene_type:complete